VRVAVTGSSGQLGGTVVRLLRADGVEVVGLDRRRGPGTTVVGDLRDDRLLRRVVSTVDGIVHTAGLHAPHLATAAKTEFVAVNVEGTQRLLDAAAAAGVGRVVLSSSTSVYGHALEPRDAAVWVDEALVPRPRDVYDVTKLAAEQLCRLFGTETGAAVVCIRVSRFSFADAPHLAVPYCLHRAVHVEDAARAHQLALLRPVPEPTTVVVSGASPYRSDDLPELLTHADAVLRRRAPELAAAMAAAGVPLPRRVERVYAIDAATAVLGYQPAHGVPELLSLGHP
jgi:nucleoside-diphosphate-sugar epimerase